MTTIVVASTNPVKIAAVKRGFGNMFPDTKFTIEGVSVASCVSHQPMSNSETEKGALSRVENAKKARPNADFWVGIEGGTSDVPATLNVIPLRGKRSYVGEMKTNKHEMQAFAWGVFASGNYSVNTV